MKKIVIILLFTTGLTTIATAQQKQATPAKVINKSEAKEAHRMRRIVEQKQLNAAPVRLGKAGCGKKVISSKL